MLTRISDMKLNHPAFWQYLIAVALAIALIASQVLDVRSQLDDGMANAKQLEMLLQIQHAVLADPVALFSVLLYVGLFVGGHILLMLLAVALFRGAAWQLKSSRVSSIPLASLFALAAITCAVMWNRRLYPQSMAFPSSDLLLTQILSPILFWGLTLLILAALALAVVGAIRRWPKSSLAAISLAGCMLLPSCMRPDTAGRHGSERLPDVILIGVDSLRPDFLPRNGFPATGLTPRINQVLGEMVSFNDALTPMARTFVAYMSILTGQEPQRHGARFNLYPRDRFNRGDTLAWRLKAAGYYTVFAMDEARFANVDSSFGFDATITPPVGVLDFAIGSAFDSIGTNLLLMIPGIRGRLSYIYGNRAAYRVYRPRDHSDRLDEALADAPRDRPLLLVSHFCLPHWPYLRRNPYAGEELPPIGLSGEYSDAPKDYMRALHAADQQIGRLIDRLRASGRLRNAVVVLLSDHGEGLGMRRDTFTIEQSKDEAVSLPASQYGHGGYVLAPSQYRVVLGMQRYVDGRPVWKSRDVDGPASLLDVAPTVLAVAKVAVPSSNFDGMSLLPALEGRQANLPERFRFVESGERAATVERANIDEKKVAAEMHYLYDLTPDLRFEVGHDVIGRALAGKQRGSWFGDYGVAAKPVGYTEDISASCWEGMDFKARKVSCIAFPAKEPVYRQLQEAICIHYAHDREFVARWCTAGGAASLSVPD